MNSIKTSPHSLTQNKNMKINQLLKPLGIYVGKVKKNFIDPYYDLDSNRKDILEIANKYSMTGGPRLAQLIQAVDHISKHKIKGDIVECGVWRGGSMLAVAQTLKLNNDTDRKLFLFDTYEGMNKPTIHDKNVKGIDAIIKFDQLKFNDESSDYCYADIDDVKKTLSLANYPKDNLNFIKGQVEKTLPDVNIGPIALLRLDTDWYESTKHELIHLYNQLVSGGILIIDDYGYWEGAKKAVDEFFEERGINIFLGRIDDTGRIAVKP
jgi:hypothetical protein